MWEKIKSFVVRFWWVLALVGTFFFIFNTRITFNRHSESRVSYSTLKQKIAKGEMATVEIGEEQLVGIGKDGMRWVADLVSQDKDLTEFLEGSHVEYRKKPELVSGWWGKLLSLIGWLLPSLLILFFTWWLLSHKVGKTKKALMKRVASGDVEVTFQDVAGIDEAVREVREIVGFLDGHAAYAAIGARIPRGILLAGPPGTGKTLLARAVAGEANVPFFHLSGSEFVEMFVGVGAARVRDLFEEARRSAPCIVFIDELDAVGQMRNDGPSTGGTREHDSTLNQLLAEMDGIDRSSTTNPVIVLAATNRLDALDEALLRPGRFDRIIQVDRPDVKGRTAILRLHAQNVKLDTAVDLATVAAFTSGFAGADLANLLNEAAMLAVRRNKNQVSLKDIQDAMDRVMLGLTRSGEDRGSAEKRITAYHEAGHALVSELAGDGARVHKVSIVGRGQAGGFMMQRPDPGEEGGLLTRRQLKAKLAMLLGGRVAEEIGCGDVSTGAADDLAKAMRIARAMATQWGMGESLVLLVEEDSYVPSEATQATMDRAIGQLLTEAENVARAIIGENRARLELVVNRLLEQETLSGEELREILAKDPDGRLSVA